MKIKRIEATWVSIPIAQDRQHRSDFGQIRTFDAAIVRIDTDTGITGWGEGKNAAGSSGSYAGLVTLINKEFAPRLIGRDARDISVIWD
ncbi:MAG: mandelate racemase/muconate lactonizing enzyme family protein, partial [Alphaproteobacteria bacterium]